MSAGGGQAPIEGSTAEPPGMADSPTRRFRALWMLVHLLAVALIGWVDYLLGPDLQPSALYVVPIMTSAYRGDRAAALLTASAAALAGLVSSHLVRNAGAPVAIVLWDGLSRLAVYLALGYFVSLSQRLARQASIDPLTGVTNARGFAERLGAEVKRAGRYERPLGVICIDCDDLKSVNDRFGHAEGDRLLVALAQAIVAGVRDVDLVARVGGDEFTVLLPESTVERAARTAQRLGRSIRERGFDTRNGERLRVTVSIGIASYPNHGRTAEGLLVNADRALYGAKRDGRDRCAVASADEVAH